MNKEELESKIHMLDKEIHAMNTDLNNMKKTRIEYIHQLNLIKFNIQPLDHIWIKDTEFKGVVQPYIYNIHNYNGNVVIILDKKDGSPGKREYHIDWKHKHEDIIKL